MMWNIKHCFACLLLMMTLLILMNQWGFFIYSSSSGNSLSTKAFSISTAIDKSFRDTVYVENQDYDDLSDTERVNQAIKDAVNQDAILIFGDRTYHYEGRNIIDQNVTWTGTQGENFDENKTLINTTGRWTFSGPGKSEINGIAIHANRSFTGDVVRVVDSVDEIIFNNCHFMGALHEKNSAAAIILNISGDVGSVSFNNGSIFDSHSTAAIDLTSTDGTTSGGWRVWPSIRGFNASGGFDGYLEMRNVDIFNIGHEVQYKDGIKVWDKDDQNPLNPGGWDIDAWQRSGTTGKGTTILENVRFRSISGSYIKISRNGGTLHFKDLNLHVRKFEPVAGRLIRLQSHGDGYQRNGTMENVHIKVDRSRDLNRMGGGSALHMLMSFSGNLPDEIFHIKNTLIEIGVHEENPIYLSNKAIFGYHRTTAPKHGLIIENTKINVPGGIEYFFRTSANANSSDREAQKRVNEITFVDNKDMRNIRRFYYANPFRSDCSTCRVYTFHDISLAGINSYYNLDDQLHQVEPTISPENIWRSGGGTFSDCGCEESVLDMYLFKVKTK